MLVRWLYPNSWVSGLKIGVEVHWKWCYQWKFNQKLKWSIKLSVGMVHWWRTRFPPYLSQCTLGLEDFLALFVGVWPQCWWRSVFRRWGTGRGVKFSVKISANMLVLIITQKGNISLSKSPGSGGRGPWIVHESGKFGKKIAWWYYRVWK